MRQQEHLKNTVQRVVTARKWTAETLRRDFMLRLIPALACLLLAGPALAQTTLPANELIEWSGEAGAEQTFTSGDITASLKLVGDDDENRTAELSVGSPGTTAATTSAIAPGGSYGQIGAADVDMSGGRSIIFAAYAGGAHCCMDISAVTKVGDGWVTDEVGSLDGDNVGVEDIDGDGIFEIPLYDDRFNYAFDAFAFSFPPPLIKKVRDGKVYDATNDPAFRAFLQAALDERIANCSGETYELASCAGAIAIATRLDTYDEVAPPILEAIAAGKKTSGWDEFEFCTNEDCSKSEKFADFAGALDYALKIWGYRPS
jgi:hypothetical protein